MLLCDQQSLHIVQTHSCHLFIFFLFFHWSALLFACSFYLVIHLNCNCTPTSYTFYLESHRDKVSILQKKIVC